MLNLKQIFGTKHYFQNKYQPTTIVKSYHFQHRYVTEGVQIGSFWGLILGFLYGWLLYPIESNLFHGIILGVFGLHSIFPILVLLNDYNGRTEYKKTKFFDSNYKKWNVKRKLLETLSNFCYDYGFFKPVSFCIFAVVGILMIKYVEVITSF